MSWKTKRQIGKSLLIVTAAAWLFAAPFAMAADAAPEVVPVSLPIVSSTAIVEGLSTDQIVERLGQHNAQRAAALRGFEGKRTYQLTYRGFPSAKDAQMEVVARYQAPESKSFDVVSESGSKMIHNKVFAKLLESEREAAHPDNQRETALTPDNYSFTLLGSRPSAYGGCYRLAVEPKRSNKFLYRGEICVNAADFAVESIDAEPAKNPSFWIKKTRIEHRYEKVGEFWLPVSNKSVTNVRMGGTATLSIQYTGYDLR
jgi:hypothetical protein